MGGARVLIVGGGLTAAALSYRLASLPVILSCWDKAFKPGGRMTTKRRGGAQIDLGPQFITTKYGGDVNPIFTELISKGILKPLKAGKNPEDQSTQVGETDNVNGAVPVGVDDTIRLQGGDNDGVTSYLANPSNYVAVNGTDEIVQYLWHKSGISPQAQHFVDILNHETDSDPHWTVINKNNDKTEHFDVVVFTQPVPQYINVISPEGRPSGNYMQLISKNLQVFENLQKVKYYSSFSLGLMYNKPLQLGIDRTVRYFPDNAIIRYMSVDTVRRGKPNEPTSIIVQTQRAWAEQFIVLDKHSAASIILAELKKYFSDLPEPDHLIPHRWRYSQTAVPYPKAPGAIELCSAPVLIGAGDSFSVSNVEGCFHSAKVASELIMRSLNL